MCREGRADLLDLAISEGLQATVDFFPAGEKGQDVPLRFLSRSRELSYFQEYASKVGHTLK